MKKLLHPHPDQLAAYSLGKLPWPEIEKVEAHLKHCDACRSQVAGLESNADSFVSCLRETSDVKANDTGLDHLLAAARSLSQPTASAAWPLPLPSVAGHELVRELARGGLGVVYLARHLLLHDLRAIKRPQTRDGLDRDMLLARFRREVEAVGSLRHDHVVRAHDAGADAEGPYLVMEYLDGIPLSRLLAHRRLQTAEACELVRQAALGLQAAHERGLVHRDVKPSNLMLARAGSGARVVVIDWGLVKRADEKGPDGRQPQARETKSGTAIGTADFIAPEQVRDSRSVDIRADIYSLGVTLYSLLAGKPPFGGRPELEKLLAQQHEDFPPLYSVRSDIPVKVLAIVKKMVAKDPAKRFGSPAEAANALEPFCVAESRLLDLLDVKQTFAQPQAPGRRRIGWVLAVAACVLLALVSLGLLVRGMMAQDQRKGGDHQKIAGEDAGTENVAAVLGDGPANPLKMKENHPGYCSSLAFTADGLRAVSESGGGSIYVWDLKTRDHRSWLHMMKQPERNQDMAGVVAVSPDGNYLVAAGLNSFPREKHFFDLYDQRTCAKIKENFAFFARMGPALAFSPGSTEIAAVDLPVFGSPKIRVIEIKTGKTKELQCPSAIASLAFSPDGNFILSAGNDKSVRLWSLQTQRQELSFSGHEGPVSQVAFSTDGKRIYSASNDDETLRVWNNEADMEQRGDLLRKWSIRTSAAKLLCTAFWPAGRALTGHADGSIILWDLDQGKELKRFSHKDVQITAVAISPDGHHAVAAHSDHSVFLYRLPPPRGQS